MQILERFGNLPVSALRGLGLDVYRLIPDYRHSCPLCGGAGCAVRHGLYYRDAVDVDGSVERLAIPRFRCQRRGPRRCGERTFSVLPAGLLPRRRYSLVLMLRILELAATRPSIDRALDELAGGDAPALLLDATAVYRLLRLFTGHWPRLTRLSGCAPPPIAETGLRNRALAAARILVSTLPDSDPERQV